MTLIELSLLSALALAQETGATGVEPNQGAKAVMGVGMGVIWIVGIALLLIIAAVLPRIAKSKRSDRPTRPRYN